MKSFLVDDKRPMGKYTFENFSYGKGNKRSFKAAKKFVKPSKNTQLFIYSNHGLGKTHLSCAIGNKILKEFPERKVYYSTSENFMSNIIDALKNDTLDKFRNTFFTYDVFILDDLQDINGRERCQEELHYIFDTFYNNQKQIILTSNVSPKDLIIIDERLLSRFESFMLISLKPPDIKTRIDILNKRISEEKISLSEQIINEIARSFSQDIRQLIGGLSKVIAYNSISKNEISMKKLKELLMVDYRQKMLTKFYSLEK